MSDALPPASSPPPPNPGNSTLLVVGGIAAAGLVLCCLLTGVIVLLVMRGRTPSSDATATGNPTGRASTSGATTTGNPTGRALWSKVAIGSIYETETLLQVQEGSDLDEKHTIMRFELQSLGSEATLRIESVDEKGEGDVSFHKRELTSNVVTENPSFGPIVERRVESVTVPAGTFSCLYVKHASEGASYEQWVNDDVPVDVKTVVFMTKRESKTKIVTTLTKITKR